MTRFFFNETANDFNRTNYFDADVGKTVKKLDLFDSYAVGWFSDNTVRVIFFPDELE